MELLATYYRGCCAKTMSLKYKTRPARTSRGGHLRKTKNYSGMRGMNFNEQQKLLQKMGKGNYMSTIKKKR